VINFGGYDVVATTTMMRQSELCVRMCHFLYFSFLKILVTRLCITCGALCLIVVKYAGNAGFSDILACFEGSHVGRQPKHVVVKNQLNSSVKEEEKRLVA
jgi:hypothetical protein